MNPADSHYDRGTRGGQVIPLTKATCRANLGWGKNEDT